jgi:tetratricopeptide (TPR) repeat protein
MISAFVLALASSAGRAQENLPEDVAKRIVRVYGRESALEDRYRAGMGCLLSPTEVLTALHVIQDCDSARILTSAGVGVTVESVLLVDPTRDIAVVKLRSAIDGVAVEGDVTRDLDMSSLGSVIIPHLSEEEPGHSVECSSRVCATVFVGNIRYAVVDEPARPGESGMPWFSTHGHLVAVFVQGDSERSFAVVPSEHDLAVSDVQLVPGSALSAPEWGGGTSLQAYAQLGALDAQLGEYQYAAAHQTVNGLRAQYPRDWFVLYACAEACLRLSYPEEAASILDEMARLAQDDAVASELRMMAYTQMGCNEEAWSQMQIAIASYGGSHRRLGRIAACSYELGRGSLADSWSEAWLAVEPWHPDAQIVRAKVLFREERFGDSAALLEEAISQFVRDDELCALLAACYGAMGECELAAHWYKSAAELNPKNDEYLYRSGFWLRQAGRLEESLDYFHRLYMGRTEDAQVPAAIMGAAMVHVELGEAELASVLVERHLRQLEVSDAGRDIVAWVALETGADATLRSAVLKWAREGKLTEERAAEVEEMFE